MPHIPGHGISFADWFRNNQIQIGQSGGPAITPNYSGMRMGGSSEAGMMNPDLWNMNIPNPMLNFEQIGSDLSAANRNLNARYFDQNRPITINPGVFGDRSVSIPSKSIRGGQVGSDLLNVLGAPGAAGLAAAEATERSTFPDRFVGTGDNPAMQWLGANQPFVSPQPSIGVPPPRAHDAPFPLARSQPIDKIGQFDTASFLTAMGQMAGVQPGVNRQEGLADAMNRVRATTMVPPPNPSDLGVPPSIRDPLQWQQAGQPYAPPATPMAMPQPSPVDMGIPPVSTEELMQRSRNTGIPGNIPYEIRAAMGPSAFSGRGGMSTEAIMASGGGPRVTDRYNQRIQNQMSSPLPLLALSQMMQRRGMN